MNRVRRLKIYVLGQRDYPEALITLPEHLVADLPDLLDRSRALNPAVRIDAVVATIWRLGSYRLGQNLLRGIRVRVSDTTGGTTS